MPVITFIWNRSSKYNNHRDVNQPRCSIWINNCASNCNIIKFVWIDGLVRFQIMSQEWTMIKSNHILHLTHCSRMTPYCVIKLGSTLLQLMACLMATPSHNLKQYWLIMKGGLCCVIHIAAVSEKLSIRKVSLNIIYLKMQPHLPEADELRKLWVSKDYIPR